MKRSSTHVIHFRLQRAECVAIALALQVLLSYRDRLYLHEWDWDLNDRIRDLARTLIPLKDGFAHTHRLRLDEFGITVCQSAVRLLRKEQKAGIISSIYWPSGVSFERLMTKLERYRKRGKRAWFRLGSRQAYDNLHRRLHRFLIRVKQLLKSRKTPNLVAQYRRWVFGQVFVFVRRVLAEEAPELLSNVADQRPLKSLTRKMIRHLRRGRGRSCVKDLLVGNDRGRWFVVSYLAREFSRISDREADHDAAS